MKVEMEPYSQLYISEFDEEKDFEKLVEFVANAAVTRVGVGATLMCGDVTILTGAPAKDRNPFSNLVAFTSVRIDPACEAAAALFAIAAAP